MGMPLKYTPLYEKARKKTKNALVETTHSMLMLIFELFHLIYIFVTD